MGVEGYVGLLGSGKTYALIWNLNRDLNAGREIYSSFHFGSLVPGVTVPLCSFESCGEFHTTPLHVARRWEVRGVTPYLSYLAGRYGWRTGRYFVPDPRVHVLHDWDEFMKIGVVRDEYGKPHKYGCEWNAVDCRGCSTGISVFMDELNLLAPSRLWQEMGYGVLTKFAYLRKDGITLYWSAQHESRIDKVPREITNFIWVSRPMLPVDKDYAPMIVLPGYGPVQWFEYTKFIPTVLTDKNRTDPTESAHTQGILGGLMNADRKRLEISLAERYRTYEHVQEFGIAAGLAAKVAARGARASGSRRAETAAMGVPYAA